MSSSSQAVAPIPRGYRYIIQIEAKPLIAGDPPAFPAGCELLSEVRDFVGAPDVRMSLSTADGTIERIDDNTVELRLPGLGTSGLGNSTAVLDLARTDVSTGSWLGIQITLPVVQPITVPTGDQ